MVTTRRRITSEQDRFGGYGIQPSNKVVIDETEMPAETESRRFVRTYTDEPSYVSDVRTSENRTEYASESVTVDRQPSVIEYSQRQYFGGAPYARTVSAPARTKKSRKREKEDVMPSIRTRAYAGERIESEREAEPKDKVKMSGKTKAALVAYVAVVLILAVMVIATGLMVSNINAASAKLEIEIAAKNNQLAVIDSEIAAYGNLDRITGAAINNGMEKIDSSIEVELVPTNDPISYEGRTNWFDKFCDFISKIIGG